MLFGDQGGRHNEALRRIGDELAERPARDRGPLIAGFAGQQRKRIFVLSRYIRSAAIVPLLFAYHLIPVPPHAQCWRWQKKSETDGATDRRHVTSTTIKSA